MAYKKSDFTALVTVDPERASARIVAAYRDARCLRRATAEELGISHGTLIRMIKILDARVRPTVTKRLEVVSRESLKSGRHHAAA